MLNAFHIQLHCTASLIIDDSNHHEATFVYLTLPRHLTCAHLEKTFFCAFTFTCVLSNVDAKLNDVSGQDFTGRTLLRATAQPLAVDEGPIAAFSVLQVELHTNTQQVRTQVDTTSSEKFWSPEYPFSTHVSVQNVHKYPAQPEHKSNV